LWASAQQAICTNTIAFQQLAIANDPFSSTEQFPKPAAVEGNHLRLFPEAPLLGELLPVTYASFLCVSL
jgi:hypothetical protein